MKALVGGVLLVAATVAANAQSTTATGVQASDLRSRVSGYLSEWHAQSLVPGVSVGVVLKDGSSVNVTAGVADRETKALLTPRSDSHAH
jgi:hypothetical protein